MNSKESILNKLANCCGSQIFTVHPTMNGVIYSEGVKTVVDECQANWLLLHFGMIIPFNEALMNEDFLTITMLVVDNKAKIVYDDGNDNVLHIEEIGFTNFPLDKITIWFDTKVLYLPQEH
ncbi:MAG: DUF6876 family protein [Flavobacteriales bacterium]|jgi:hypothetical protein